MVARAVCKDFGLELLTLQSKKELDDFKQIFTNTRKLSLGLTPMIITGGITRIKNEQKLWLWDAGGEDIPFGIPFAPGEPNNPDENCLCICNNHERCKIELLFADCPCTFMELSFFCEAK
jgi:hypothetical protein